GAEQPVAMRLQRLAALVVADRVLQRHVAVLQLGDDLLELLQRRLEGEGGDVRRNAVVLRFGRHARPRFRAASASARRESPISAPTWAAAERPRLPRS